MTDNADALHDVSADGRIAPVFENIGVQIHLQTKINGESLAQLISGMK